MNRILLKYLDTNCKNSKCLELEYLYNTNSYESVLGFTLYVDNQLNLDYEAFNKNFIIY
jgi:hypothetical protein